MCIITVVNAVRNCLVLILFKQIFRVQCLTNYSVAGSFFVSSWFVWNKKMHAEIQHLQTAKKLFQRGQTCTKKFGCRLWV